MDTKTTIPAAPGWYVAEFSPALGAITSDDGLDLHAIIAWDIYDEDEARIVAPLLLGGYAWQGLVFPWIIKRPDGWFETADGSLYEIAADVIAVLKREYEARQKARGAA